MDAFDAYLIGEQQIWGVTNGEVYKWKCLWRMLTVKFDLEPLPYEGECFILGGVIKNKGLTCHAIANENKLFH